MSYRDIIRAWAIQHLPMRGRYHVDFLLACLLAVGLLFILSPQALAANRYGVVCLINETGSPINYLYRVGNISTWERKSLEPGARQWFWYEYEWANEDRSPPFYIRFDSDLSAGRFGIEYRLIRYAPVGHSCQYGKQYAFRYDGGNRRYIDLQGIN